MHDSGQTLEEAGYTGWADGEPSKFSPDGKLKEDCGSIFEDGLLHAYPCTDAQVFICEHVPQ